MANLLLTRAEYQAAHIIESTAQDNDYTNAELDTLVDQAAAWFEAQCQQEIGQKTRVERMQVGTIWCSVDGDRGLQLYPRFSPIISVAEILYRTTPSDTFSNQRKFATTDFSLQDLRRIVIPFVNPFRRTDWGEIQLTYDSGYVTVPSDVKYAVILLTAFFASAGYAAVDVNDQTARQVVPSWAWDRIKDAINKYKRRF